MNTNLHFVRDHHGSDKVSPVSGAAARGHVFLQMVLIFSLRRFLILTLFNLLLLPPPSPVPHDDEL